MIGSKCEDICVHKLEHLIMVRGRYCPTPSTVARIQVFGSGTASPCFPAGLLPFRLRAKLPAGPWVLVHSWSW